MGSELWPYSFSPPSIFFYLLWGLLNWNCSCLHLIPLLLWLTSPALSMASIQVPWGASRNSLEWISKVPSLDRSPSVSVHSLSFHPGQPIWRPQGSSFAGVGLLTEWLKSATLHGVYLACVKLLCPCYVKLWECRLLHWGLLLFATWLPPVLFYHYLYKHKK